MEQRSFKRTDIAARRPAGGERVIIDLIVEKLMDIETMDGEELENY